MKEGRCVFKTLTGKPSGKKPLQRPRSRWEDNIRMKFIEMCVSVKNWIGSSQDCWVALVNATLNLWVS